MSYAEAAYLDPSSPECRQLYIAYQETQSNIDAARNLGGGITQFANVLGQNPRLLKEEDDNDTTSK